MHPARLVEYRGDDKRRPYKMRGGRAASGRSGYLLTENPVQASDELTGVPWMPQRSCLQNCKFIYRILQYD
jgi:hypothetical protein